ncbi:MAG: TRAP transporter large permease subunit, partial [Pseudomonadota bacterium]
IILADQLASAVDQAGTARKALYKETTGNFSMPSEFGVVSTSAGEMFLGALVPGLVLVGLYMTYVLILGLVRPKMAPSVEFEGKLDSRFFLRVGFILIPPLTLIFAVLGSIITGVATVNQAGAIGAVGAMIMAGYRLCEGQKTALIPALLALGSLIAIGIITNSFQINIKNIKTDEDVFGLTLAIIAVLVFLAAFVWSGWRTYKIDDTLHGVMVETAKTTSLVFIILLGAAMLTAAFRAFGGEELVREFLTSLPGGFWAQFIIVMAVIFIMGFFLDFIEIAVVVVPIVAPILLMDPSANITAVWLGVMIGLNIQTSFLTPPFGFALFYLRGVAPAIVRTVQMYKGVIPFIALQLVALVIVGNFPSLVNYLPARNLLTSEVAPPPRNPGMQHCIEEYNFARFAENGATIKQAIADAQTLDVSYLPRRMNRDLTRGFESAGKVFALVDEVKKAEAAVAAKVGAYRPLHREVREIQKRANAIKKHIKELDTEKRQARGDKNLIARIDAEIAELAQKQKTIEATIPANWKAENKAFVALQKAETNARRKYRRGVDTAYTAVGKSVAIIRSTDNLIALEKKVRGLGVVIDSQDAKKAVEEIQSVRTALRKVEGANDIRSALGKARRELRRKTIDTNKARAAYEDAIKKLDAQLTWRKRAQSELLAGLTKYDEAIRNTIGLRQQPRLPREQALYVAACNSGHRDISLSF